MIHEKHTTQQDKANKEAKAYGKSANWKHALATGFARWQDLAHFLEIDPTSYNAPILKSFPMRIPLSFASRMKKGDINDPLLLQVLPSIREFELTTDYVNDPLQEGDFNPSKGILHKYKNRVLLILHPACAVHCRYCFRREYDYQAQTQSKMLWLNAFDYIRKNTELDEVIFSGGDPLMHNDTLLAWFLRQIEAISHIKRLRIHTRIPVVLPARITNDFIDIFKETRLQKIMVIHANHANEINDEVIIALNTLKKAAEFTLLNQSTLLKGVNDNVYVLKELSESLFAAGVMPYYLHVLDKIKGAAHFDIDTVSAKKIHTELKSLTSGYLVPKLVQEVAHETAKTWIN
ncbi:EF-P beta-lysylation protein EpmB [Cysteiniphilum halobium]|uniref:EF-P beta-lysylation protein EpmB n=1 Tax=Cysteiniphilum halobium TaxID=2219059 RepID=UPI000E655376|nr:EF-P beta-lysylation protein EpmB [Cysteiniphilum halobium]